MRSRLALLAVVARAGVTLAACQRDPNVAATVGSDKITEAQVDELLADVQKDRPAPETTNGNPSPSPLPPVPVDRADVVRILVLDKVCAADQARRHFANGQAPDAATQFKISPNSQYAKAFDRALSCLSGQVAAATPVTPTDAEVRDIYDRAAAAGLQLDTFDATRESLKSDPQIQQNIAAKRDIEDQAKTQNVLVSPRYRPLEQGLLFTQSGAPVIVATVGQTTDAIQSS
jgi:hypothetical protein